MTRRPKKRAVARKPAKPVKRRVAKTPPKLHSLDDFIAAGAHALELKIDDAWLPAVRSHLEVTLRHGASVTQFALPDEAEPAPVFKA